MKKLALILLLGLHLFILVNLQFTAWPEVLSFPYLMSKGFILYKDAIHVYPPLLDIILLGIFKIFGFKLLTLQIFTWILILVNDLLIFSLVKKLNGHPILALLIYVLLQPVLEGNMLWYDTALVTPILASLYFYLVKKNLWLVGFFLAVTVLIKQTAGIFVLVFLGYLISQKVNIKKILLSLFVAGISLFIYLLLTNSLTQFINWCFYYPFIYWSEYPGYVNFILGKKDYLVLFILFLPILVGTVKHEAFCIWLLLTCLVMVYPRFSYFHLQPAIALAVILGSSMKKWQYLGYALIILILITLPALRSLWGREARFYSLAEFTQADYLNIKIKPDEKVYLLGDYSSLYVLADRIPPKIWTDNFGWYLEIPGVQQEIINSWETNKPKYIVWQLANIYQPQLITDWIRRNYSKIEKIDNENSLYQLLPK